MITKALKFIIQPWRARNHQYTSRQLGALLVICLVWIIILAADNNASRATIGFLQITTVLIYPVLVVGIVRILHEHPQNSGLKFPFERLLTGAPLLGLLGCLLIASQSSSYLNPRAKIQDDITASIICASQNVLHGRDPYTTGEIACLHSLGTSPLRGTVLQRGPLLHQTTYPSAAQIERLAALALHHPKYNQAFATFGYLPMSYVWMLPVAGFNHTAWVAYTLLGAVILLVILGVGAGELWPAVLLLMLLQFGTGGVVGAATQGDGEVFTYGVAILALAFIDRPRLSGVLLGIGMAAHPLLWAVGLGYLVFARTLPRFRERVLWLAGTTIILIVPWLIVEPHAINSIIGLILQPNFPSGIGVITLLGPSPALIWRHISLAMLVLGYGGLCLFLWRRRDWLPILPVVALAFMWLSWRSDVSYLAQVFPFALAMIIGLHRLRKLADTSVAVVN